MNDTVHFEKTLSSETLFEGRVITLTKDTALLENGKTATREVVHHHGGACILPYFADGTICMVRQFRYAMQQQLWELPAGKLEKGEDPFAAAKRELEEECGLTADNYISLGEFYPTVGYDTEVMRFCTFFSALKQAVMLIFGFWGQALPEIVIFSQEGVPSPLVFIISLLSNKPHFAVN
ncbi:MAG: NUDIX domain-containing protein [Faecalibacterium prausnitzii]